MPAQPRYTRRIQVKLTPDQVAALDCASGLESLDRAAFVRAAIQDRVARVSLAQSIGAACNGMSEHERALFLGQLQATT